jgi:hypothetical protein
VTEDTAALVSEQFSLLLPVEPGDEPRCSCWQAGSKSCVYYTNERTVLINLVISCTTIINMFNDNIKFNVIICIKIKELSYPHGTFKIKF